MVYMDEYPLIPTEQAIAHLGRRSDGYGGKAALARLLKVTIPALDRFSGPYLPEHHARELLRKDHTAAALVTDPDSLNENGIAKPKRP